MVARGTAPKTMTADEFLDWVDEDTSAEWVDGEVILNSPASRVHERLRGFLQPLLRDYTELHDLGEILDSQFFIRLPGSVRAPDILFVSKARLALFQPNVFPGAPDLVVEIVSPDSEERDRVDKLKEYEQHGVAEYWLLDPRIQESIFRQLGPDGRYRIVEPMDGVYESRVVAGLRLPLAWLWNQPPLIEAMTQLRKSVS
jgi:Uma2 family endonuclease